MQLSPVNLTSQTGTLVSQGTDAQTDLVSTPGTSSELYSEKKRPHNSSPDENNETGGGCCTDDATPPKKRFAFQPEDANERRNRTTPTQAPVLTSDPGSGGDRPDSPRVNETCCPNFNGNADGSASTSQSAFENHGDEITVVNELISNTPKDTHLSNISSVNNSPCAPKSTPNGCPMVSPFAHRPPYGSTTNRRQNGAGHSSLSSDITNNIAFEIRSPCLPYNNNNNANNHIPVINNNNIHKQNIPTANVGSPSSLLLDYYNNINNNNNNNNSNINSRHVIPLTNDQSQQPTNRHHGSIVTGDSGLHATPLAPTAVINGRASQQSTPTILKNAQPISNSRVGGAHLLNAAGPYNGIFGLTGAYRYRNPTASGIAPGLDYANLFPSSQGALQAAQGGLTGPSSSAGAGLSSLTPSPNSLIQYALMQEIKNIPQGNDFHVALTNWEWTSIDGVRLPCVFRNNEKYLAVHMVQMRLLAKFPPNVPADIMRRYTMVSHKMMVLEAWIFNTINAVDSKYEFGYQLFTPNDEVVKLFDVERFYWAVKAFNLSRMTDLYKTEIRVTASLHLILTAHISSLKAHAEAEFRALQAGGAAQMDNGHVTAAAAALANQSALNNLANQNAALNLANQSALNLANQSSLNLANQSSLNLANHSAASNNGAGPSGSHSTPSTANSAYRTPGVALPRSSTNVLTPNVAYGSPYGYGIVPF